MTKRYKNQSQQNNNLSPKFLYAKTDNQALFIQNYASDKHQLLLGHPGTGKTYLALHCALLDLHNYPDKYKQIIVIRPPVQGQAIGFTPGTEQEKAAPYENPYAPIVNQVMGRGDAYGLMKQKDIIKFELTTFLRGTTFENTIVILDEFQNCTSAVADTVLTRIGHNSKLIICGDLQQRDLTRYSEKDVEKFLDVVEHMPNMFDIIHFEVQDVVRSGLVAEYIKRKFKTYPEGY
jgi:phosphate starvation-inducible protein PhoH